MASTYSSNLAIELIGTGEQSGTWGTTTNTNLGTLIEQAISGYVTQAITDGSGANTTITIPNGATGVARNMFIEMTGALTFSTTSLIVPANKKMYFIFNNTTGGFAVTVKVSGQTGILVPNGKKVVLTSNGTDIVEAHTAIVGNATMGGTLGITGTTTAAAINASGLVAMAGAATVGTTLGVSGTATMAAINASGSISGTGTNTWTLGSVAATGSLVAGGWLYGVNNGLNLSPNGTGLAKRLTMSYYEAGGGTYREAIGFSNVASGNATVDILAAGGTTNIGGTLGVTGAITASNAGFGGVTGSSAKVDSRITDGGNPGSSQIGITAKANFWASSDGYINGSPQIAFGSAGATYAPAAIGMVATSQASFTCGDLVFSTRSVTTDTQPTERMRISSAGAVTIPGTLVVGTATLSAKIEGQIQGSDTNHPAIFAKNNYAGSAGMATFYSSLGDGTNSVANTNCYHLLAVSQGSATYYLYGNGTTSFTSDERLKKNIETTRNGYVDDLCKLRVVKYQWKSEPDEGGKELGLIAQEVEQVFPGLVQDATEEMNGFTPKVLKASVLPFMLLKAIQEQQTIITALTTRITALEAAR